MAEMVPQWFCWLSPGIKLLTATTIAIPVNWPLLYKLLNCIAGSTTDTPD
jgi:hypothetical protein